MAITADTLRNAALRASAAAAVAQDDLNAADGKIGDGDTGVMLRRLFEAIAAAIPFEESDIGQIFQACAKACASGTGSSLGTLVTVAMMTLAKATKGRNEIGWDELGGLLASVRDQMMTRGGATIGDKTVVDMLDAVAIALTRCTTRDESIAAAQMAARETLDAFRERPNRLGRARMFGERTIGLDDPGMLAFSRLLAGVAA
ncbi:dihydroxyacetone kinase subunit L [Bradyrhizobium yuanmingense]|uniref:dihydroxyacetone kinase subunit L n=1 Tax=Bradyrhizobium yuanmingense TaxID=108015 RepID=UPI0023B98909|nr:dihydroxyacetone kinase subunit L [Bradyrhizobium yuanmingense]MDF0520199.1 dihydroxyacetone kinase subunit L [Bradyrhizobium yuanmingense]